MKLAALAALQRLGLIGPRPLEAQLSSAAIIAPWWGSFLLLNQLLLVHSAGFFLMESKDLGFYG